MGSYISGPKAPAVSVMVNLQDTTECGEEYENLYKKGIKTLENCGKVHEALESYTGCEDIVRMAMSNPKDEEKQVMAFEGMFPNISKIKQFYQIGKEIDEQAASMVRAFVEMNSLADAPALIRQFAEILNYALKLDRCKMSQPAIQNDFSFYRRALGKNSRHKGAPVDDVQANNISMYIAQSTPVISTLVITMDNLQRQIQVDTFLADFTHICCAYVMKNKIREATDLRFALTGMTVAIVIYDQIHPVGVFSSSSTVQVKTCVQQLKLLSPDDRGELFDALQYSTKTYQKAPDNIKKIIQAR